MLGQRRACLGRRPASPLALATSTYRCRRASILPIHAYAEMCCCVRVRRDCAVLLRFPHGCIPYPSPDVQGRSLELIPYTYYVVLRVSEIIVKIGASTVLS